MLASSGDREDRRCFLLKAALGHRLQRNRADALISCHEEMIDETQRLLNTFRRGLGELAGTPSLRRRPPPRGAEGGVSSSSISCRGPARP